MKRLLVYLIVIFSIGFIFNANAKVMEVCKVGERNHLVKIFSSEKKYNKDSILKSSPYMNCNTHFKLKNKNLYGIHVVLLWMIYI